MGKLHLFGHPLNLKKNSGTKHADSQSSAENRVSANSISSKNEAGNSVRQKRLSRPSVTHELIKNSSPSYKKYHSGSMRSKNNTRLSSSASPERSPLPSIRRLNKKEVNKSIDDMAEENEFASDDGERDGYDGDNEETTFISNSINRNNESPIKSKTHDLNSSHKQSKDSSTSSNLSTPKIYLSSPQKNQNGETESHSLKISKKSDLSIKSSHTDSDASNDASKNTGESHKGLSSFFNAAQAAATHLLPKFSQLLESPDNKRSDTLTKSQSLNGASPTKQKSDEVHRFHSLKNPPKTVVGAVKGSFGEDQRNISFDDRLNPAATSKKSETSSITNDVPNEHYPNIFLKNLNHLLSTNSNVGHTSSHHTRNSSRNLASNTNGSLTGLKSIDSRSAPSNYPIIKVDSIPSISDNEQDVLSENGDHFRLKNPNSLLQKSNASSSSSRISHRPEIIISPVTNTAASIGMKSLSDLPQHSFTNTQQHNDTDGAELHRTTSGGSLMSSINFKHIKPYTKHKVGNGNLTLDALGVEKDPEFDNDEVTVPRSSIEAHPKRRSLTFLPQRGTQEQEPSNGMFKRGNSYNSLSKLKDKKARSRGLTVPANLSRKRSESITVGPLALKNSNSDFEQAKANSDEQDGEAADYEIENADEELLNADKKKKSRHSTIGKDIFSPKSSKRPSTDEKIVDRATLSQSRRPSMTSEGSDSSSDERSRSNSLDAESMIINLQASNEKKNKELHSLFGNLIPPDEKLITEYVCAYSKDILIQGKMYVTPNYILFKANIFGWITSFSIVIKDIVQLEKKNTAVLFPNAISIQTLHKQYVFASFMNRDASFELITQVWNNAILRGVFGDSSKGYHKHKGKNNGVTAAGDELHVSHFGGSRNVSSEYISGSEEDSSSDLDSDFGGEETESDSGDERLSDNDDMTSDDEYEPPIKPPTSGPTEHAPTDFDFEPKEEDKTVCESLIDAPLGSVYNILFGNDVHYLQEILEAQGNYNLSKIPQFSKEDNTREYSYTKPISGSIGPSKTSCSITETIKYCDFENYCQVDQISKTPDIPSGSSFQVRSRLFLTWGSKNKTKITVIVSVEWSKKSWIKSAVEKGTFEGVKETSSVLADKVKEFAEENKDMATTGKKRTAGSSEESEEESEESSEENQLPTREPQQHAPTSYEYQNDKNDTVIIDNKIIDLPLGTVFEILFGKDTSSARRILEKQNNKDISEISAFHDQKRNYEYIKPLGSSIGPKQTKCLVEEIIEHDDMNSYFMVKQLTKSPDVPSGNAFVTETQLFFCWAEDNKTKFFAVTKCVWSGKSWIKGAIEKGSIDGQKESLNTLLEEIPAIVKDFASSASTKKGKTGGKRRKKSLKKSRRKTLASDTKSRDAKANEQKSKIDQKPSAGEASTSWLDKVLSVQDASYEKIFLWSFFVIVCVKYLFGSRSSDAKNELKNLPGRQGLISSQYQFVPSLNKLYMDNHKKKDVVFKENETDIWSWINNHNFPSEENLQTFETIHNSKDIEQTANGSNAIKESDEIKTHGTQDLQEFIKIAELELGELKSFLKRNE
ncbi:hypothetical protein ACO0QE_000644 [Hanseniaspora vineae]